MLKTVILALNPLEPSTWTTHEVTDIRDFLLTEFKAWPPTARIYHEQVCGQNDVTPACEADIEKLGLLAGTFYVIVYPGDPITIMIAAVVVIVAAAIFLKKRDIPLPAMRNTQSSSPNNELSDRTNRSRPMARIPDIYGTVRATPDLIAVPYKIFKEHEEVEYATMCIGRGHYDVSPLEVRDGTTLLLDIAGASAEVYAPNTSPNSGHAPQLLIGAPIDTPVLNAVRSNSVNGQILRAPNDQHIKGNSNIRFSPPNQIQSDAFDFTDTFVTGDALTVSRASQFTEYAEESRSISTIGTTAFQFGIATSTLPSDYSSGKKLTLIGALFTANTTDSEGYVLSTTSYDLSGVYYIDSVSLITVVTPTGTDYFCRITLDNPSGINPKWSVAQSDTFTAATIRVESGEVIFDLAGVYTILAVSEHAITLSNPAATNAEWSTLSTTEYLSPILSTSGPKWIGPFVLEQKNRNEVFSNFVAVNGLYKDDGTNQLKMDVVVEVELTPINPDGTVRGDAEVFQATVEGSANYKSNRAVTLKATTSFEGRCRIRARRITQSDLAFEGTVVDEIKWRDVYSISPVTQTHFGNVTTVHTVTYANAGALAVKERKFNMLVTRKLPQRIAGSNFSAELYPTNRADDIFSAICMDPYIGARTVQEIDFDNIYDILYAVRNYFGNNVAGEFSYTFDSDNLSFEETANVIAEAVFSTAYRRGNVIKLSFEKETEDSTLLFNHRNKIPGSETRTVRFGRQQNYDGVSYQYMDPEDDSLATYYIPEDRSAINPKPVETIGVRSKLQAHFHAWRAWNKIQHQHTLTEFQATQEADLLIAQDRILVADNTRSGTQDGEILSQNALLLTLSQPVVMLPGSSYSIFLQHTDGTVESIPITADPAPNKVLLSRAPKLPLALEEGLFARASYIIVSNTAARESAFLLSEKTPQSNFTSVVKAVNYDGRYYQNDKDFINAIVNGAGDYL